eukprot:CAMPEP_0197828132 /NCGR_PEP_ID=MMETSP1437-20131217/4770_1 /TAXON_ID=49252 ORGANISM="Eucampia antarctica, Strain CCMP1452" /NCGR_SAMPLE_ID=MMETSP1437 /ASSEMBLY_ACC=CAM_ASM_001096 /LENGTH=291 /DNA_ID=CAMNT_0043429249 /DNA_START=188 /DNA_END=1063 /DNA_ORIENTATION=+
MKITIPANTDVETNREKNVSKSYSPISHPSAIGYFELVVKSYPFRPGGGVGAYLCNLQVHNDRCSIDVADELIDDTGIDVNVVPGESNDGTCNKNISSSIIAELKSPRMMHGSSSILNRWKHVGLIAGGTGIAPLFQIAKILLEANTEGGVETTVHLLDINRQKDDILMRDEIDTLVRENPGRFFVTHSLTQPDHYSESKNIEQNTGTHNNEFKLGRGSSEMALDALPPPGNGDGSTMVLICGKDGFVESWGGAVGRAPNLPDGTKGNKIQGPLLGWLAQAGYRASEVFKY